MTRHLMKVCVCACGCLYIYVCMCGSGSGSVGVVKMVVVGTLPDLSLSSNPYHYLVSLARRDHLHIRTCSIAYT